MLDYLETRGHIKSRIGYVNRETECSPTKKVRAAQYRSAWVAVRWIALAAVGYFVLGMAVQYGDSTAGWLDIGSLSLPLFAAWAAMVGYAIAGLLPVMLRRIGKRGGIKRWKSSKQLIGMAIVYIGYIVVLCALL